MDKALDRAITLAGLLLVNALALLPLLHSGYLGDDILNSQIRGHMIQTHKSLWEITSYYPMLWLRSEGRFFPFAFYCYPLFYYLDTVLSYKIFVLFIVLTSIAAYYVFLLRVTRSRFVPTVAVLLLPILFQFRLSWDPILAFHATYPLITVLLFTSLNLFLRSIEKASAFLLSLSVVLFFCASLIFEVTYLFASVYFIIAFYHFKKLRSAVRVSWPFLGVTISLVLFSIYLRKHALNPSGNYQMHLDIGTIFQTYLVQIFGATPFAYYFLDPHSIFGEGSHTLPQMAKPMVVVSALAAALIVFSLRKRLFGKAGSTLPYRRVALYLIGGLLFGLPAVLISLSPKFQAQVWGDAYLPVYMAYFGCAMIFALVADSMYRAMATAPKLRSACCSVAFLAWGVLVGFNAANNDLVVNLANAHTWSPRVLLERAIEHGLLKDVGNRAIILVDGTSPWDTADEYSGKTKMLYRVIHMNEKKNFPGVFAEAGGTCARHSGNLDICHLPSEAQIFTVQVRHISDGNGTVVLTKVKEVVINNVVRGIYGNDAKVYVHFPASVQKLKGALSGNYLPQKEGVEKFHADHELNLVEEGNNWKMMSFRAKAPFDVFSLHVETLPDMDGSTWVNPKSASQFLLKAKGKELLRAAYGSGQLGKGIELMPINFQSVMQVEILVTPDDQQNPYAEILSNHWGDFRGLSIEQVNQHDNQYAVFLGTGKTWVSIGNFVLTPYYRSHIAFQIENTDLRLYVNGKLVSSAILPEPIVSSPYPVTIGNWKGGNRRFTGWIEEILITGEAKTADEIIADANRLRKNGLE